MNPDEILKVISILEEKYAVDSITYKGNLVWPIIRQHLGFTLFFQKTPSSFNPLEGKTNKSAVIKTLLASPFKLIKWRLLRRKASLEYNKVKYLKGDIWFLSSPEVYIDKREGKKYCRYLDPYYEVIRKEYESSFFSTATATDNYYYPVTFFNHSYHVQSSAIADNFLNRHKVTREELDLMQHILNMNSLLKENGVEGRIPLAVISDIRHIWVFEQFFTGLFNKKKPKVVFVQCFYSTEKFAMVAACNKQNIKTVEIQHGGAEDFMYVPWREMNRLQVYLPGHMWCWSQTDKDLIVKYNGVTPFLKPFVGGNMWMKKFRNSEIGGQEQEVEKLAQLMHKYKKTILISLQWSYKFPDKLLQIIKNSESEYLWLLRFHPLTPETEKQEILFAVKNLKNVEFELCGRILLYSLFEMVDNQITFSSTTAMEALSFNIQTILIHPHGLDYYKDLVNRNVLVYADTQNDIERLLGTISKKDFPYAAAENFIIKTDETQAQRSFKKAVLD